MTKSELIEQFAERAKRPKKQAEEIVNSIIQSLTLSILKEDRIEIRGFGSFSIKDYKPYRGRNPKTGDTVQVKAKKSVHFKVGKELKERVNQASENAAATKKRAS
jgi:integration host factor subunit beta